MHHPAARRCHGEHDRAASARPAPARPHAPCRSPTASAPRPRGRPAATARRPARTRRRTGHPPGQVGQVHAQPLGQRSGQVAHRAVIGQRRGARWPVRGRRRASTARRPAPSGRPRNPSACASRASRSRARKSRARRTSRPSWARDPPRGRRDLDGQVDQQRGGAADHLGARATLGQFGQVRQVGQLAHHEPGRLDRVGAGQRADAGHRARGPEPAGLVIAPPPPARILMPTRTDGRPSASRSTSGRGS